MFTNVLHAFASVRESHLVTSKWKTRSGKKSRASRKWMKINETLKECEWSTFGNVLYMFASICENHLVTSEWKTSTRKVERVESTERAFKRVLKIVMQDSRIFASRKFTDQSVRCLKRMSNTEDIVPVFIFRREFSVEQRLYPILRRKPSAIVLFSSTRKRNNVNCISWNGE